MYLKEIRDEVEQLARRRNLTDIQNRFDTWINQRIRRYQTGYYSHPPGDARRVFLPHNWSFTHTKSEVISLSASGGQEYDLPDDYKDDDFVYLLDSDTNTQSPLKYLDLEDGQREYATDDSGEPEAYTINVETGEIWFWPPVPDDDYSAYLWYYKWFAALSGDAPDATNAFTADHEELCIAGGAFKTFEFLKEPEMIKYWANREHEFWVEAVTVDKGKVLPDDLILMPHADVYATASTERRPSAAGSPYYNTGRTGYS